MRLQRNAPPFCALGAAAGADTGSLSLTTDMAARPRARLTSWGRSVAGPNPLLCWQECCRHDELARRNRVAIGGKREPEDEHGHPSGDKGQSRCGKRAVVPRARAATPIPILALAMALVVVVVVMLLSKRSQVSTPGPRRRRASWSPRRGRATMMQDLGERQQHVPGRTVQRAPRGACYSLALPRSWSWSWFWNSWIGTWLCA